MIEMVENKDYPKTYEECCELLGCKSNNFFTNFSYNGCDVEISEYEDKVDDLLHNFRKLIYVRDAYWKIAGEEMGLGKPWKPDWKDDNQMKLVINFYKGLLNFTIVPKSHYVLTFPDSEMRYIFCKNFEKLIEQCKELL